MATEISKNIKYTVFDNIKNQYINWTGFDANYLDGIASIGNELIIENESLKKQLVEAKKERKDTILRLLWDQDTWKSIALIVLCIVGLGLLINLGIYLTKYDAVSEGMAICYKAGQIDALTGERILYTPTPRGYTLVEDYKKYIDGDGDLKVEENETTYYIDLKE